MAKEYTKRTTLRTARPRSGRLQGLGSVTQTIVVGSGSGSQSPSVIETPPAAGITFDLEESGHYYHHSLGYRPSITVMAYMTGKDGAERLSEISAEIIYHGKEGEQYVEIRYDYPGTLKGYVYMV